MEVKRVFFIFAFLLLALSANAESSQYRWFHHINATSDIVRAVCPDASGQVWFGTIHGLFRYGDYTDDIPYNAYPKQFQKGVTTIIPSPDGRLYVRTQDGVWSLYDPVHNQVETGTDAVFGDWGIDISGEWDPKIKNGANGEVLCFQDEILYRKRQGADKADVLIKADGTIRDVCTNTDEYAVITDSLLYIIPYDKNDGQLVFPHGIKFHRRGVWVSLDGAGNPWIGSEDIIRFERRTLRKQVLMQDISVMDVIRRQNGDILIATGTSGILLFNQSGKLVQRIEHQPFDGSSIASNNVREIQESSDGSLWVCYYKPMVSVCSPESIAYPWQHITPLQQIGKEENVISIAQAPDGDIWFGTDGQGLYVKSSKDGSFSIPPISLSQPAVTAVFFDSKKRAWIGTYLDGLYCMDNNRIHHYFPNTSCFDVLEDSAGDIWAGMQGAGIFVIPGDLNAKPVQITGMDYFHWVFQQAEYQKSIFAATSNGLVNIGKNTLAAKQMEGTRSGSQKFRSTGFSSLLADSRGLLWLAGSQSDSPLEIYDIQRDTILYPSILEGYTVKNMIEDDDRNIWISTQKELIQIIIEFNPISQEYSFHPLSYQIHNSGTAISYQNSRAAAKLADGSLLFGGSAGYEQIQVNSFPPHNQIAKPAKISIASLKVNNRYVGIGYAPGGRVILEKDISTLPGISLSHNENNITLAVSCQNYTSPFETDLLYRIANKDTIWIPLRDNLIELSRLSPGHYDLEISNRNPDGSLSGTTLPFSIEVRHPWYTTWWAILIYILLSSFMVASFIYYYADRKLKKISLEEIRQEADHQRQLNEMKLRFFTNISHDFRTPLSLIITPLETYMEDPAHKSEENFFKPIYRNALQLLTLVNQILDFRKIEAGSTKLNLSYGNLVTFLQDVCSSFTLFADEKKIQLRFASEEEEILTEFDKDKISKVLMNLLSNAFKFTPTGGSITVRLCTTDEDAVLTVADTGPGIPNDKKEALFDRFYQIQSDNSDHIGSGLGLHIVKEFVELHGGCVEAADNVPNGASFNVRIPLRTKDAETVSETTEESIEADVDIESSEKKNLLLVEDNLDFLNFVKEQLTNEFNVHTATNGNAALQVIEKEDIHIIISDIMMEGMDGLELCKYVKSNIETSHIPFILLTAKAMAEDEIIGLKLGADEYVTKPFHMQILRLRIKKLLDANVQAQRTFKERLDVSPSEITITPLDELFIAKAIRLTEENMENPNFSVEMLSSLLGMHRTNLYKKLLAITGKKPLEFIRLIRLKHAAQYLLQSKLYVSEIAYRVGYNSPKLFSKQFHEEFGMSPREYQHQNQT